MPRGTMRARGFGDPFRHSTGHGVGFAAIDHNALPRIHPASRDQLETGMVFNLEPAAYVEGFGGVRHCDVVALTNSGPQVLTAFQTSLPDLVVAGSPGNEGAAIPVPLRRP